MSRYNTLPVILQQLIESFQSEETQEYVKVNQLVTLENIRDACNSVILDYKAKQLKKKK